MGARSRRKGARAELELAARLRVIWPAATRALGQARGDAGQDIDGVPGWWWQVSAGARPNIRAKMRQALEDMARVGAAAANAEPIVATRRDRDGWLVTMRLERFLELALIYESQRVTAPCAGACQGPAGEPGASPGPERTPERPGGRGTAPAAFSGAGKP